MKVAGTVFIFVGPPGSGKGSLAQQIEKEFGFIQLSTGNLCRKVMAQPSELGKKVATLVQAGSLLPDELMVQMVRNWLDEQQTQATGFIFDGFPRTVEQAHALAQLLQEHFPQIKPIVVHFILDDDIIMRRVASRIVCTNKECQRVYSSADDESAKPRFDALCDRCGAPLMRRTDDKASTIAQRLITYHKNETSLLQWYKDHQIPIITLHVDKPLADVFEDFKKQANLDIAVNESNQINSDETNKQRKTGRAR